VPCLIEYGCKSSTLAGRRNEIPCDGVPRIDKIIELKRKYKNQFRIEYSFGYTGPPVKTITVWCKKCRRVVCYIYRPYLPKVIEAAKAAIENHNCLDRVREGKLKKKILMTNIKYYGRLDDFLIHEWFEVDGFSRLKYLGGKVFEATKRGFCDRACNEVKKRC